MDHPPIYMVLGRLGILLLLFVCVSLSLFLSVLTAKNKPRANKSLCKYLRQPSGVWNNQYQQQEHRRRFESRRTFSAADHDFDDQPAHYLASNNWAQASAPQYHSAYVSPWTNRFSSVHRIPGPSNYYLPVATPPEYTQFIVRPPYQPWMRQVVKYPLLGTLASLYVRPPPSIWSSLCAAELLLSISFCVLHKSGISLHCTPLRPLPYVHSILLLATVHLELPCMPAPDLTPLTVNPVANPLPIYCPAACILAV